MIEDEKINFLVADSEPDNFLVLEDILNRPETNLLKATTGDEALALARRHDLAVILLDVALPDMQGFDVAEVMSRIERTKNTPIIFISAERQEKLMFKAYESGAVDYLFKPLHPKILASKLKVFLDLYKQRKLLENQGFELEKKMTELSTVLLYLQGKEKLLTQQALELSNVNQELSDFAYIVSHDLKAPLRAIGSLADWIAADYADKLDEQGKEQLSLLIGRVKRMHNLIDAVLQYSRVGRVKEQKVEINLNELVQDVIEVLAPPRNVTITIENELPTILFEKIRMEQVFQNLISNSIKYMDKPNGEIKIASVEENDYWKITVEDNGPGIEEKYFEKVFQIFQALDPRDEYESTGVGLSVVKKIIESNGGRIWIESKVGSGSKFIFTVPT